MITCDAQFATACPGLSSAPAVGVNYYYLFKHGIYPLDSSSPYPQMTGKELKLSGTQADIDPTTGGPIVTMQFTGQGQQALPPDHARRGAARPDPRDAAELRDRPRRPVLLLPDDRLRRKYGDGIDPTGTGAEISGIASQKEAQNLALVLQTGALPVKFVTVERSDVSATLGKDSLRQARNAAIAGLILVALFLLVLYRFLGVVAVFGLAIYSALMYGAILLLDVTLTLPGFAGLILTIGVAADANVVIFERIKEEARAGRSVRASIAAGYAKGFRTIVDANVVTAITALILFAVATAEVKGFALMLLIGTVDLAPDRRRRDAGDARPARRLQVGAVPELHGCDRFRHPALAAHRRRHAAPPLLRHLARRGRAQRPRDHLPGPEPRHRLQGRRPGAFRRRSPPRSRSCASRRRTSASATRSSRAAGSQTGTDSYESFQLRIKKLQSAEQDKLTNTLTKTVGAEKLGVKNVSASFSRQILNGAILAILVSFALIALYVTLRFRWRFAVPILRTLLNDIPIMLGVYAISGREVSADTVAAILTILGYSVYDTIIVFDRVRENMKLMPRASVATIVNIIGLRGVEAVDRDLDDHAAPDHRRCSSSAARRSRTSPSRSSSGSWSAPCRRSSSPRRSSRACSSAIPSTPAAAERPTTTRCAPR